MTERLSSLERLIADHRRVALDANVLIYLLESSDSRADFVAGVIDAGDEGRIEIVLSTVALTEVLTGPARLDDGAAFARMAAAVRDLPVRWVAVDEAVAEDAAWIRGRSPADLGNAMHLAAAARSGASVFLTNDRDIRPTGTLAVAYLDDLLDS